MSSNMGLMSISCYGQSRVLAKLKLSQGQKIMHPVSSLNEKKSERICPPSSYFDILKEHYVGFRGGSISRNRI